MVESHVFLFHYDEEVALFLFLFHNDFEVVDLDLTEAY